MNRRILKLRHRLHEAFLRGAYPHITDPAVRRVARAIKALPLVHREVYSMFCIDHLTMPQIAQKLDMPERWRCAILSRR